LLEAVVRVVSRAGVDAVTFRSVAAEAGVTYGLAHYHFRSRDVMIVEALRWAALESQNRWIEPNGTLPGFFEHSTGLPSVVANDPDGVAFQFAMAVESVRRPEIRDAVKTAYEGYFEQYRERLVADGLPAPEALCRLLFAAVDGLMLQQLIFGDASRTAESLAELHRLLTELGRVAPEEATSD
jgi:AcrR family transcriptional regulator